VIYIHKAHGTVQLAAFLACAAGREGTVKKQESLTNAKVSAWQPCGGKLSNINIIYVDLVSYKRKAGK